MLMPSCNFDIYLYLHCLRHLMRLLVHIAVCGVAIEIMDNVVIHKANASTTLLFFGPNSTCIMFF